MLDKMWDSFEQKQKKTEEKDRKRVIERER